VIFVQYICTHQAHDIAFEMLQQHDHNLLNRTQGGRKELLTIHDSIRNHAVDYWGTWLCDDTAKMKEENENSSSTATTFFKSSVDSSCAESWVQGKMDQSNVIGMVIGSPRKSKTVIGSSRKSKTEDAKFSKETMQQPQSRQKCRQRNKTRDSIAITAQSGHKLDQFLRTTSLGGPVTGGEKSNRDNVSVGDFALRPPPRDQLDSTKIQEQKTEQITGERPASFNLKTMKSSGTLSIQQLSPTKSPDHRRRRSSKQTSVESMAVQRDERLYFKSLERAQLFDAIEEEISAGRESSLSTPPLAAVDPLELGEVMQTSQPSWHQPSAVDAPSQHPRLGRVLERLKLECIPRRPSITSYCSTVTDDSFPKTLVQLHIPVSREDSLRVLQIQIS
jgi:hypothetical protein